MKAVEIADELAVVHKAAVIFRDSGLEAGGLVLFWMHLLAWLHCPPLSYYQQIQNRATKLQLILKFKAQSSNTVNW